MLTFYERSGFADVVLILHRPLEGRKKHDNETRGRKRKTGMFGSWKCEMKNIKEVLPRH